MAVQGKTAKGREAKRPRDIPRAGWMDVLKRTKDQISEDNLSLVSAGVAFYFLLAVFPALAALVSLYGLVADPASIQQQISSFEGILPQQVMTIIQGQMESVAQSSGSALGFGLAFSVFLSLWSAAKGMKALMTALNIVYNEEEGRGFFMQNAVALVLTLGAVVFAILSLTLIIVFPPLIEMFPVPKVTEILSRLIRWPLLAACVAVGIGLLYRYAPSRAHARTAWISWGSGAATVLWLIASVAFSLYVTYFGSYNATYGSLGAVVILLLWFFLTAFVVLLGGELNGELEHQTGADTTTGPSQPMGRRGAHVADTLGKEK